MGVQRGQKIRKRREEGRRARKIKKYRKARKKQIEIQKENRRTAIKADV